MIPESHELQSWEWINYQSPRSLWFQGTSSRRQSKPPPSFELPTLAPAKRILRAITKLRTLLDTEFMDNRAINMHYGEDVSQACDRYFADLIGHRSKAGNLYTQLSRTIYARIATHWYAPPDILDIDYMALIQGHQIILDTEDLETKKILAEKRHYFDYFIGDKAGNINQQQGIHLQDPNVHLLQCIDDEGGISLQPLSEVIDEPSAPEQRSAPLPDLQAAAQTFITALAEVSDPEAIRALVKREIAKFERYSEFLDVYRNAIQAGIRSGALPLIDGETASRTYFTQAGVKYEQRRHYALIFLEAPDTPIQRPEPPPQPTPQTIASTDPNLAALLTQLSDSLQALQQADDRQPQIALDRKLDILIDTLTVLCLAILKRQQKLRGLPSSPPPQIPPSAPKRGRGRVNSELANAHIHKAIDAIMAYNNAPGRTHAEKWHIGKSSLKRLTHSSQAVIRRVFEQREREIEKHHKLHRLSKHHNLSGHEGKQIGDVIEM